MKPQVNKPTTGCKNDMYIGEFCVSCSTCQHQIKDDAEWEKIHAANPDLVRCRRAVANPGKALDSFKKGVTVVCWQPMDGAAKEEDVIYQIHHMITASEAMGVPVISWVPSSNDHDAEMEEVVADNS